MLRVEWSGSAHPSVEPFADAHVIQTNFDFPALFLCLSVLVVYVYLDSVGPFS